MDSDIANGMTISKAKQEADALDYRLASLGLLTTIGSLSGSIPGLASGLGGIIPVVAVAASLITFLYGFIAEEGSEICARLG